MAQRQSLAWTVSTLCQHQRPSTLGPLCGYAIFDGTASSRPTADIFRVDFGAGEPTSRRAQQEGGAGKIIIPALAQPAALVAPPTASPGTGRLCDAPALESGCSLGSRMRQQLGLVTQRLELAPEQFAFVAGPHRKKGDDVHGN